jgi:hypothetical protein
MATCESCGSTESELYGVHRRYVTPEAWDTPGRDITLTEVEQWCFACCSHYPHRPAGIVADDQHVAGEHDNADDRNDRVVD